MACFPLAVLDANPLGHSVTNGSASFNQQGNSLNITNSPGTIIDWQKFSIQKDETTRFIQQSVDSAVLNRVVGQDPSQILGKLQSNGRVFIINPNGILFGANSIVDVGGLVASTLSLTNENFISQQLNFNGDSTNGNIDNQGAITTAEGGFVYLIAPNIENHGVITSPKGEVILAAGYSVQLVNSDNPDLRVTLTAPDGEALNVGDIITRGGKTSIYAGLINQQGIVSADSAVVGENGRVFFKSSRHTKLSSSSSTSANGVDGGSVIIKTTEGLTEVSGAVSTTGANGKGGSVQILGEQVGILDAANIDASGLKGGGTVLIGGDNKGANANIQNAKGTYVGVNTKIHADAIDEGDGGTVIIWADDATHAYGTITAKGGSAFGNGGFVETSGGYLDIAGINLDVTANNGDGGSWLLDPYDITISGTTTVNSTAGPTYTPTATASNIFSGDIVSQLNAGTSVTVDTTGAGAESGNITVNAAIIKTGGAAATLTLKAHNNINTNFNIGSTSGALGIVLTADQDSNGIGAVSLNGTLNSLNGNVTISAAGDIAFNSGVDTIKAGTGTVTLTSANGGVNGDSAGATTDVTASTVVLNALNGIFANSGSAQFTTKSENITFNKSGTAFATEVKIHNSFAGASSITGINSRGNIEIFNTDNANALTVGNLTATVDGYVSINTNIIDIVGLVNANTADVYIMPLTNNPISIDGSETFDLTQGEINNVSAGKLFIGSNGVTTRATTAFISTLASTTLSVSKINVDTLNNITFGANKFTSSGKAVFKSSSGNITTGTGLVSADILVLEGSGLMSIGSGGIKATNYAGLNGGDIFISGVVTSPIFYLSVFNSGSTISIGGTDAFNVAQADIDFISAGTTYIGNNPYVTNTNNVNIATASTIDFGARNIEVKSFNGILVGNNVFKATGGNIKLISTNVGSDITTGSGNIEADSVTIQSGRDVIVNSGGINAVNSITLKANNSISQNGNLAANGTGTITVTATNQDITMASGTTTTGGNGDVIYSAGNNITLAMLDSGLADTSINAGADILDVNGNGVNNINANNLTINSVNNANLDYQIVGALNSTGVLGTADLRIYPSLSTNEPLTTTIDTISATTNSLSTESSLSNTSTTAPLTEPASTETTTEEDGSKEETQAVSAEEDKKQPKQLAAKKLPICK